uniref:Uncharacterized protein n=1 Tax=Arundo donax TaxID=35708 RepID=A0A0A9EHZ1_ARUDO
MSLGSSEVHGRFPAHFQHLRYSAVRSSQRIYKCLRSLDGRGMMYHQR